MTDTVTVKPDIDLIEQAISDVIEEGGNYRDAAEYVAKCLAPQASDSAVRDRIARLITLDHLQLLQDFDVDGDLYRLDPECAASAYVTADAIIAQQTPAQAALIDELKPHLDALPAGPWKTWTSNSFRRITGPDLRDGGVLHAYTQRSDGHPDLSWTEEECEAICAIVNRLRAIAGGE